LVHVPDPRRPTVYWSIRSEGQGAALRSRESGSGADVDHASAVRRQALPFSNLKFAKNDSVFEFEVQVPRDAEIVTTKKKITTSWMTPARPTATAAAGQRGADR